MECMKEKQKQALKHFDFSLFENKLKPSNQEKRILENVNEKVAESESIEDIIDFLFDATRDIWPCDRICLAFVEEQGKRLRSHYVRTLYKPILLDEGYIQDLQGSSFLSVLESGKPHIIDDLQEYSLQHPESRSARLLAREGSRSSMTCPLYARDHCVGVLIRNSRKPYAYSEHNVRMHLAVAQRLGQAVEKAYRIEQLREANRAYTEMLGFVSHELKSPLASIITDGNLILDGYLGEIVPKQEERISRITDRAQYLLGLVKEYLDLARIESGELKIDPKQDIRFIPDVLQPALDMFKDHIEALGVRLVTSFPDEECAVACDPYLMNVVVMNLLGNAVKYGCVSGEIRVKLELDDAFFRISFYNKGPGFPESQTSALFQKFSRLDTPELRKVKGSGIGLYTCWRIVNLHYGRIWAESEEGKWAEFHCEIPQPLNLGSVQLTESLPDGTPENAS
jgi:signal transduction histidine kinase